MKESDNINIGNRLNKLIIFKKVYVIYIWFILLIILIGLAASGYFSNELYNYRKIYYNFFKNK